MSKIRRIAWGFWILGGLSVGIVSAQVSWDGTARISGPGLCLETLREQPIPRPPVPVVVANPSGNLGDLPNFQLVSPGLYRSAQPSREDFIQLQELGIRTVLNLTLNASADAPAVELGMRVLRVPMTGVIVPSFGEVDRAIRIMADPGNRPLLVHCHFGRDRTGVVVAAYRVAVEGMAIEDAALEAESFGCCPVTFKDLRAYLADYRAHYFQ